MGQFSMGLHVVCNLEEFKFITRINILPWCTWHLSKGPYNGVAHAHPSCFHYKVDARSLTLRSLTLRSLTLRSLTLRSLLQPWLTFLWLIIVRFPLAHAHARVNDPSMKLSRSAGEKGEACKLRKSYLLLRWPSSAGVFHRALHHAAPAARISPPLAGPAGRREQGKISTHSVNGDIFELVLVSGGWSLARRSSVAQWLGWSPPSSGNASPGDQTPRALPPGGGAGGRDACARGQWGQIPFSLT
jgi:hypothetical protein